MARMIALLALWGCGGEADMTETTEAATLEATPDANAVDAPGEALEAAPPPRAPLSPPTGIANGGEKEPRRDGPYISIPTVPEDDKPMEWPFKNKTGRTLEQLSDAEVGANGELSMREQVHNLDQELTNAEAAELAKKIKKMEKERPSDWETNSGLPER